ncbi:hypothetical protein JOQ06_010644, partial [Pogonophryne albipinna]
MPSLVFPVRNHSCNIPEHCRNTFAASHPTCTLRSVRTLLLQDNECRSQGAHAIFGRQVNHRYLATGDSYRTISFSYRVGHATVAVIVREVAGAIWTALVEETMPVPQTEDWRAIAAGFQERWNFPNCVGAIDGKHVVIQAPANSGSLYFNYKSTHSLVLLAVVDAQYLFRVVDVGGFGRSSDSGSLRNSAFGESLRDGSLQLPPDTVIPGAERRGLLPHVLVGDEAFPLLDNLLRPFPGRQLTRERRMFNYRLSQARLVVECAFGILSSQWRMFRRVITTSPEVAELCVKATCVLHNFLRRKTIGRTSRTPIAESTDEAPATPTLLQCVWVCLLELLSAPFLSDPLHSLMNSSH